MKSKSYSKSVQNGNRTRKREKPRAMTEEEYIEYHKTGYIDPSAYEKTEENMDWLKIKDYPILIKSIMINGKKVEFRKSGEKLHYVKLDKEGEIVRDEKGESIYLTNEEIIAKKLPFYDLSIIAFTKEGEAIGFASDEWGATGIFVLKKFQRKGLGLELLTEFRKQIPESRKIGQMTPAGEGLVRSYFKRLKISKKAIKENF